MGLGRLFTLLWAGLLSVAAAAPAIAAPVAAAVPARARTEIKKPAAVRLLNDLNFGYLGVTTAGTAVMNPNTDVLTTTGGVVAMGGNPYSALFESVAPVKGVVIVRIPKNPITITRVGGTETMTVSNWTIDGSSNRTVNAKEPFSFKVGGTLFVNANQVEGFYIGTFTVDVQYP
ncbi:MAG: DUF4402 domain-containing protein [Sphingomonas sp.]|nr:DUF4402 domain-containing protein [Sphingomonas sp.]